jgi:hypothetical protein
MAQRGIASFFSKKPAAAGGAGGGPPAAAATPDANGKQKKRPRDEEDAGGGGKGANKKPATPRRDSLGLGTPAVFSSGGGGGATATPPNTVSDTLGGGDDGDDDDVMDVTDAKKPSAVVTADIPAERDPQRRDRMRQRLGNNDKAEGKQAEVRERFKWLDAKHLRDADGGVVTSPGGVRLVTWTIPAVINWCFDCKITCINMGKPYPRAAAPTSPATTTARWGAVQVESSRPMSLKPPGFNPRTYKVKNWFQQAFAFACNLYRYSAVAVPADLKLSASQAQYWSVKVGLSS